MKDIQKIKEFFSKPLNEEETAIDMAKKQLDQLGAKYEMSGNKFKPFKAIYKPVGKSDDWYDKFDEIVYLFNLGSAVKSSMSEASPLTKLGRKIGWAGEDWTPQEFAAQIKKLSDETLLKWAEGNKGIGKGIPNTPLAFQQKLVKIELAKRGLTEAQEEDVVDTITMDVPLFIRMLEYSREDASADVDLHDVTEKAISLNKEKDILSMDDYNEIVGAAEEIEEGFYGKGDKRRGLQNQSKLSSAEYQMAKKLKSFKASDWKWNADEDLYNKVNEVELTEANVPSNIKEFAKRKGVSSLVNKVAGWAERVGKRIAGGTAVGKNYSTLVLDLDYQQNGEIRINTDDETVTLYDEPVNSFPEFKRVYLDDQDDTIEEGVGNDLDEPYFIEVSVRDARKAMDMFDDMYRRSNIKTYGSNVYAASTPEDIYDLYYDLNNQGIEILDYNVDGDLDEATDYMKRRQAQNDYAVSKKDKPAKSTNPNASGDTDYMKRRKKELAEVILTKLKK